MFPSWYIPPHKREAKRFPIRSYLEAAAFEHDLSLADLLSQSRQQKLVQARHIAWYAIRKNRPDVSLPQIARHSNRKDHTTILHGITKIAGKLCAGSPTVADTVRRVERAAQCF